MNHLYYLCEAEVKSASDINTTLSIIVNVSEEMFPYAKNVKPRMKLRDLIDDIADIRGLLEEVFYALQNQYNMKFHPSVRMKQHGAGTNDRLYKTMHKIAESLYKNPRTTVLDVAHTILRYKT